MRRKSTSRLKALEQTVRAAVKTNNLDGLPQQLAQERPAEVASVINDLPRKRQVRVFNLLDPDHGAQALSKLGADATQAIISALPAGQVGKLLDRMAIDDAARVIGEVPKRQAELLAAMAPDQGSRVRTLLGYPPGTAGRMITDRYASIRPQMRVGEAFAHLRSTEQDVETITDLYVLDDKEQLVGVVSLRELIMAGAEKRVADIMTKDIISVRPETTQKEVAALVSLYDFLALPVVTAERRMLGIITVDDVIDVLVEEGTEEVVRFGGVEGGVLNQPYFSVPIWQVVRRRVGWLLLLFLAETLTGSVLRLFESELARVVALSFFIPLLIGTGGNTGAQTVSTLIRGLALGEVHEHDVWRVLTRELASGLLIGVLLGIVAFGRSLLWGSSVPLSLVVALTILAICTWANTIGSLIPLLAHKLGIDPAVVSAPLITTLVDATGLAIYLLIAKALLGL